MLKCWPWAAKLRRLPAETTSGAKAHRPAPIARQRGVLANPVVEAPRLERLPITEADLKRRLVGLDGIVYLDAQTRARRGPDRRRLRVVVEDAPDLVDAAIAGVGLERLPIDEVEPRHVDTAIEIILGMNQEAAHHGLEFPQLVVHAVAAVLLERSAVAAAARGGVPAPAVLAAVGVGVHRGHQGRVVRHRDRPAKLEVALLPILSLFFVAFRVDGVFEFRRLVAITHGSHASLADPRIAT